MSYVSSEDFEMVVQRLANAEAQIQLLQARLDAAGAPELPAAQQEMLYGSYGNSHARSRSPRPKVVGPHSRSPGMAYMNPIEQFITDNQLDGKCREALECAPWPVQQAVVSQGPAAGRNPSAMVMGRIAKAVAQIQ